MTLAVARTRLERASAAESAQEEIPDASSLETVASGARLRRKTLVRSSDRLRNRVEPRRVPVAEARSRWAASPRMSPDEPGAGIWMRFRSLGAARGAFGAEISGDALAAGTRPAEGNSRPCAGTLDRHPYVAAAVRAPLDRTGPIG